MESSVTAWLWRIENGKGQQKQRRVCGQSEGQCESEWIAQSSFMADGKQQSIPMSPCGNRREGVGAEEVADEMACSGWVHE
mmetsp:Transcript_26015/g.72885  ORF Transcript_26015/g.72885 Transcript_26015/m.72885 type:complete len:81 (-) Transcript_26015:119-361(-)